MEHRGEEDGGEAKEVDRVHCSSIGLNTRIHPIVPVEHGYLRTMP
jgi:hypothetical protein